MWKEGNLMKVWVAKKWFKSDKKYINKPKLHMRKNTPVALKHFLYEKQWNTTKHHVLVSKVIGLGKL